ncbi:MAG TPA: AbrB/MazE/SpoVT family DNA-binding domain-containing protein [Candidatus Nanoarchaeia archaeon]|nr:AbrB/MazE/SpoVT family DNA-binding domain-containing protein [Candidatus Nanoarchaeia archaeon]
MRRKIIRQGSSTLTLSLPAKWARKNHLTAGSEVEVDESERGLLIGSIATPTKKTVRLKITKQNRQDIRALLTHAYRMGFDTIVLQDAGEVVQDASEITRDLLLGFEVTDRTGNQLTISNLSEPAQEKYGVLVRRSLLIIKETLQVLAQSVVNGKFNRPSEVEDLKKQQDKFVLFCRRILMRGGQENALTQWELLTFMMHIEHATYYLYSYGAQENVKPTEQVRELVVSLERYFQLLYDAYSSRDLAYIHKINELKKEFQFGKCYDTLAKAKGKDAVILSHLRELFRLVQVASSPILGELVQAML